MTKTKLILLIAILIIIIYAFFAFDVPYKKPVETGNITDSMATADKIFVESPQVGAKISSPVKISGQARGPWFFEASFPVKILAADGTVLGQGHADAKAADGAWMTSAFVPWTATITFVQGTSASGSIRLEKDNPSGDPDRDEHLDIPITF